MGIASTAVITNLNRRLPQLKFQQSAHPRLRFSGATFIQLPRACAHATLLLTTVKSLE